MEYYMEKNGVNIATVGGMYALECVSHENIQSSTAIFIWAWSYFVDSFRCLFGIEILFRNLIYGSFSPDLLG